MLNTLIVAGLLSGWFILSIAALVLMIRAKKHRTDISEADSFTAGSSWALELNVLNPDNYKAEGKRQLVFIYICIGLQVVFAVAAAVTLVS